MHRATEDATRGPAPTVQRLTFWLAARRVRRKALLDLAARTLTVAASACARMRPSGGA